VAILETKLAMARNPGWLRTHSVLGLNFGTAPLPRMPARFPSGNRGNTLDADETRQAIHVQMAERRSSLHRPIRSSAISSSTTRTCMLTETMENAASIYELALRYDTPRAALAKERLAQARVIVKGARR
jgi:hypothetical protein